MSRTLTSPRCQAWSRTCRSSLPSASDATSLGRRNPRRRNRGAFMAESILKNQGSDVNSNLVDELDVNRVRNDAALVAFGEQAADSFAATFAVIERQIVHPHRDKAIRQRRIHVARELHRVLQSVFAIVDR